VNDRLFNHCVHLSMLVGKNAGGITVVSIKENEAEEERARERSSLGLPCDIPSYFKNPSKPPPLDESGGHCAVVQVVWSGRRAPSTLAPGDEHPMSCHEPREDCF
jgi:hypothetical protein